MATAKVRTWGKDVGQEEKVRIPRRGEGISFIIVAVPPEMWGSQRAMNGVMSPSSPDP